MLNIKANKVSSLMKWWTKKIQLRKINNNYCIFSTMAAKMAVENLTYLCSAIEYKGKFRVRGKGGNDPWLTFLLLTFFF